jgi:phosphate:Na+ symporter
MIAATDIWKMLAGIAFFLLAMNIMEDTLRQLAGRSFKLFLKRQTGSRFKTIAGAAIVTGLLQSSSIVNLLVLNLAGAGVVKMNSALALILGANLGSTFNSWLVVTLGFSFDIGQFVLPVIGIAGIAMAFVNREGKWFGWIKFIFSFALLFFALQYIKNGMEGFVQQTDLAAFKQYPLIIFLLLGVLLTAVVQSSSATVVLTLSALHANAISLYIAMAVILGSEIGTSLKLFLASANGPGVKKKIAWGNFIINTVTVLFVFIFLRQVNYLVTNLFHIKNDLVAVVFFQTFINIISLLLFLPFLHQLGRFLEKHFSVKADESFYINKVSPADAGLALAALENEAGHLISHVIDYSLDSFELKEYQHKTEAAQDSFLAKTISEKYNYIKQLYGEMHNYYLRLQKSALDKTETERLAQLVFSIRNCMYAAKNIRDAQHDIEQMRNSSNDIKYNFYLQSRENLLEFYLQVKKLLEEKDGEANYQELTALYQAVTTGYRETLELFYRESMVNRVNETEISTLINFNRELYTSYKSILFGLKDYLLNAKEAAYFDELPGFIR